MFEIANFTSGLIPNAGWSRARNVAAQDQSDLRPSDQGFLEDRRSHETVYDGGNITQIFAYKTLLIAIIDANLRWGRARPRGEAVTFQDFDPVINLNTTNRWQFQPLQNATGEYIFMGNGTGEITGGLGGVYVIDLTDVFNPETPQAPTAAHFYLNKPSTPTIALIDDTFEDDHIEGRPIAFRIQAVQEIDGVEVAVSEASDAVLESGFNTLKDDSEATDVDDNDGADEVRTQYRLSFSAITNTLANKIYIYRGERNHDGSLESQFRRVGIVDATETSFTAHMELTDDGFLEDDNIIPDAGEKVPFGYIETDGVRSYVASPFSSDLYLSYFDPQTSIRLFRNFSDTIALPIDGERITGVKFLREGLLAVYTPHRIVLVATDPLPELCQVTSVYTTGPNDEPVGCIAPESLVQAGAYHYFLSANYWVYRFGSREPQWISASVQPILNTVAVPENDDASLELINAIGAFHQGHYLLSIPSLINFPAHSLTWRGQQVAWRRDTGLEWREDFFRPNATLLYEYRRNRWYRDGFGVEAYAKDQRDRLYGIVGGNLLALYDGDNEDTVSFRLWKSNQIILPPRTLVYNVFVKSQIPATLTVTVKTESGEETSDLLIEDVNDYWASHMGCQLYGRTVQVTVESKGPLLLDRISINEDQAM